MVEIWVVTVGDRPPMVFDTEAEAVKFVVATLMRALGAPVMIGMSKSLLQTVTD